jgi:hypothetical protein
MIATQTFPKGFPSAKLPLFLYTFALAGLIASCGADTGPRSKKEIAIAKLNTVVQKANEALRIALRGEMRPTRYPRPSFSR